MRDADDAIDASPPAPGDRFASTRNSAPSCTRMKRLPANPSSAPIPV